MTFQLKVMLSTPCIYCRNISSSEFLRYHFPGIELDSSAHHARVFSITVWSPPNGGEVE